MPGVADISWNATGSSHELRSIRVARTVDTLLEKGAAGNLNVQLPDDDGWRREAYRTRDSSSTTTYLLFTSFSARPVHGTRVARIDSIVPKSIYTLEEDRSNCSFIQSTFRNTVANHSETTGSQGSRPHTRRARPQPQRGPPTSASCPSAGRARPRRRSPRPPRA
jgi:hypothetical protein